MAGVEEQLDPRDGSSSAASAAGSGFTENEWDNLITSIKDGLCTPFLGAGACYPTLPLGSEIASKWDVKFNPPFRDPTNLTRIAQYIAVMHGSLKPVHLMRELLAQNATPDFGDAEEPHALLSELPLKVYVTTNYDNFMLTALRRPVVRKKPQRWVCLWNRVLKELPEFSAQNPKKCIPTIEQPVVFHMHGVLESPASMVLTEDHYLDFVRNVSKEIDAIPLHVRSALTISTVLFLGYSLEDLNFKILLRQLEGFWRFGSSAKHVAVLVTPKAASQEDADRAEKEIAYVRKRMLNLQVNVFFGTCREFTAELRRRWRAQA